MLRPEEKTYHHHIKLGYGPLLNRPDSHRRFPDPAVFFEKQWIIKDDVNQQPSSQKLPVVI